jgi:hypothetical protein
MRGIVRWTGGVEEERARSSSGEHKAQATSYKTSCEA